MNRHLKIFECGKFIFFSFLFCVRGVSHFRTKNKNKNKYENKRVERKESENTDKKEY